MSIFVCRQLVAPMVIKAYADHPAVRVCPPVCRCERCAIKNNFRGC